MEIDDEVLKEVARRMRGDMLRHRMSLPDEEHRRYWQVPDANHSMMLAASALAALKEIPVVPRMEVMGMEQVRAFMGGCGDPECCGSYVEVEPDDLGDLWREP